MRATAASQGAGPGTIQHTTTAAATHSTTRELNNRHDFTVIPFVLEIFHRLTD